MSEPIVYLCGGINGLSDSECKDWREYAKSKLSRTLDPMRRDYRGREAECVDEIVNGDLEDIDASDVVLANCMRPSWGTAMEVFYAYQAGKTVYIVAPKGCSPWLMHHCTERFDTLDEALEAIGTQP